MGLRSVSTILFLLCLTLGATGCGSDASEPGVDPNESASTRAIREKVRAQMEIERLQRHGKRIANVAAAAAASPTATSVPSTGEGAAASGDAAAASGPPPERGSALYAQNCASCHGPRGGGDGPVAASLVPQPAKHHDGAYMNALSNEHLFKVIKEGGPAVGKAPTMAAWGATMSDDQIRDVVAFVRTLAEPPYTGAMP